MIATHNYIIIYLNMITCCTFALGFLDSDHRLVLDHVLLKHYTFQAPAPGAPDSCNHVMDHTLTMVIGHLNSWQVYAI